jgi:hypothetical protein
LVSTAIVDGGGDWRPGRRDPVRRLEFVGQETRHSEWAIYDYNGTPE